jgi:hypothetical protein
MSMLHETPPNKAPKLWWSSRLIHVNGHNKTQYSEKSFPKKTGMKQRLQNCKIVNMYTYFIQKNMYSHVCMHESEFKK